MQPKGPSTILDSSEIISLTNTLMNLRRKDVKDEVIIFQSYTEPYLDCLYEVSAEIVNKDYSFQSCVQRYSDNYLLKDAKVQQRYQDYLNREVIGASEGKVDWHLEKTLTKDFQVFIEEQTKKVVKYISK